MNRLKRSAVSDPSLDLFVRAAGVLRDVMSFRRKYHSVPLGRDQFYIDAPRRRSRSEFYSRVAGQNRSLNCGKKALQDSLSLSKRALLGVSCFSREAASKHRGWCTSRRVFGTSLSAREAAHVSRAEVSKRLLENEREREREDFFVSSVTRSFECEKGDSYERRASHRGGAAALAIVSRRGAILCVLFPVR